MENVDYANCQATVARGFFFFHFCRLSNGLSAHVGRTQPAAQVCNVSFSEPRYESSCTETPPPPRALS